MTASMPASSRARKSDFLRLRVRWDGLLVSAGVVACAGTVFGFLGPHGWLFDLFSHFRVQ